MIAEPPIVQQAERVKTWMRLFVLLAAVAGIAALVAGIALGGAQRVVVGVALAAMFWCGATYIHLMWLATQQPHKRTHRIATPSPQTGSLTGADAAYRVGLRPHLPLALLVGGLGMALFFATAGAVLDSPAWMLTGAVLALLCLLPVPDAIRALTATGRCAVIDAHGLTYTGYSYETRVAWDDVASIDLDTSNRNLPAMAFTLRPGHTLTWTRRRWLARFEPTPESGRFVIPGIVFDQPWQISAICEGMTQTPADHRPRYLESVGSTMLTDPATPRP